MVPKKNVCIIAAHIGSRIKERRKSLNIKRYELAKELQVTVQQIAKYENGLNQITTTRLYKICRVLSTTPNFFYEGLEDMSGCVQGSFNWLTWDGLMGRQIEVELSTIQGTVSKVKVL